MLWNHFLLDSASMCGSLTLVNVFMWCRWPEAKAKWESKNISSSKLLSMTNKNDLKKIYFKAANIVHPDKVPVRLWYLRYTVYFCMRYGLTCMPSPVFWCCACAMAGNAACWTLNDGLLFKCRYRCDLMHSILIFWGASFVYCREVKY